MRSPIIAGALALFVLAGPVPAAAEPVVINTLAIPLNDEDEAQVTIGRLRYRGGMVLSSPEPRFGGFSALGISPDGGRMIALSDKGLRLRARLVYDRHGNLAGVRDGDLGSLSGLDGAPLSGKRNSDAESLTPGVEGEIIVAFEGRHRLWRYFPGNPAPEPLPPPLELRGAPTNGGIEALTMLDDGSLLALTEKYTAGAGTNVLGWISDETGWSVLTLAIEPEFWPTGAATLPDGDVVVSVRHFSLRGGAIIRLQRIAAADVRPGARLQAQALAEIRYPLNVDNFEGIEARRGAQGETLIYVISDDNYNPLQRTLMMMFEVVE